MAKKQTAGERLRSELDALLADAGEDAGEELAWDHTETAALEGACAAADRAESMRRLYDAELAGDPDANRLSALTRLTTECRQHEKTAADMVARMNPGVGSAGSARHRLRR